MNEMSSGSWKERRVDIRRLRAEALALLRAVSERENERKAGAVMAPADFAKLFR